MEGADRAMTGYERKRADQAKVVDGGALEELDEWLSQHEKALESLRERLGPVLRMDSPHALSQDEAEPPSQLRGRARRLRGLTDELVSLIERIDL